MPQDQKKLNRQPDSPKGKLTLSDLSLDDKHLGNAGIKNPMQVIRFLNSPEGKALKSEIEKELAIAVEQQKEREFEHHEKMSLLKRIMCACLLKKLALHAKHAHAQQQEAQLLREMLLDDPNDKSSAASKHLTDAAHQLTPLYHDLDTVQEDLEALEKLEEELRKREEELNQHLRDMDDPDHDYDQSNNILEQLKQFFERELAALQNELKSDVAKSSQPSPVPVPQPQSQAQQKQTQQMRSSFSQRMLSEINKLTPANQPTPDHAAQQHLRQNPEQLKTGLKNIHTQVREQYDAMRTGLSEQKGKLNIRRDELKRQIDLTERAALSAISKSPANKAASKNAPPTHSSTPEEPKSSYRSPTPFKDPKRP